MSDGRHIFLSLGGYYNFATGFHLGASADLSHCTNLINDEGLGLLGTVAKTTGFVDVPLVTFSLVEGNCIGELYVTGNLNGTIVLWYDDSVAALAA